MFPSCVPVHARRVWLWIARQLRCSLLPFLHEHGWGWTLAMQSQDCSIPSVLDGLFADESAPTCFAYSEAEYLSASHVTLHAALLLQPLRSWCAWLPVQGPWQSSACIIVDHHLWL